MSPKKIIEGYSFPIECIKLYDIPFLELAKPIIEKNAAFHVHLPVLADKVGINEFKLKISFRGFLRKSPYQYRIRLELDEERFRCTDEIIEKMAGWH